MHRSFLATGDFDQTNFTTQWQNISSGLQLRASFFDDGPGQKGVTLSGQARTIDEAVAAFFDLPCAIGIRSFSDIDKSGFNENQAAAYCSTDPSQSPIRPKSENGIYDKLSSAMEYLLPVLKTENKFQNTTGSAGFGLANAARKLDCDLFSSEGVFPVVHIFSSVDSETNVASLATRSSHIGMSATHVSDDKELTKILCEAKGIVTPQTYRADTPGEAIRRFCTSSWDSAVIKPSVGSHGEGISVDLRSYDDIIQGWHAAKAAQPYATILIEEFIASVDLRVLVFAGRAEVAMMRVPANVVGDGTSSVEALVRKKNALRRDNPRLRNAPIVIDEVAQRFLKSQGRTVQSVPSADELVLLRGNANLSSGGDSIVVTQMLDPGVLAFAENAARAFKLERYCGVDLLIRDLSKGDDGHNVSLCEINSRAEYGGVIYPMYGPAFDSPSAFLRAQLAQIEATTMPEPQIERSPAVMISSWTDAFIALGFDIEPHKKGFFASRAGQKIYISNVINSEVSRALCRPRHKATISALLKAHGISVIPGPRRFKRDDTHQAEEFLSDLGRPACFVHGRKRKIISKKNHILFLINKWGVDHFTLDPVPPSLRCDVTVVDGVVVSVDFSDNVISDQGTTDFIKTLAERIEKIIPGILVARISMFSTQSGWSFGSIALLEPKDIQDDAVLIKLALSILSSGSAVSFSDAHERPGPADDARSRFP